MKLSHIPLLTCIGVVVSVLESQGLGFGHKDVYPCLEVQTKKVNIKILQSYIIKTIPIDAVLFTTKNGTKICAEPNESWVKNAIIELDKQGQKNQSPKTESRKKVKKPAGKTKKTTGKKTQGKQKKRNRPSQKSAKVKSIRDILSTRSPAAKP